MLLTESQLNQIGEILGRNISDWGIFDIVTAWRCLETSKKTKGQLSTGGWSKKLKDIEKVFNLRGITTMTTFKKEISLITGEFVKDRIDTAPEPTTKKSANTPPYWVWRDVIVATKAEIGSRFGSLKLRSASGHLLMVWSLATGARMDELLRLRKSDLDIKSRKGLSYIKLTIRRSKRSRDGRKPVFYYAHERKVETDLCPIRAFLDYAQIKVSSCL